MILNRSLSHLGMFTPKILDTVNWYCKELGFELYGDFTSKDGFRCMFIRNNRGISYELISPPYGTSAKYDGRIDHIAYNSTDIETDYDYCMKQGYHCSTNGIQTLDNFWLKGCRYFKISTSTGEEIEFCQIL